MPRVGNFFNIPRAKDRVLSGMAARGKAATDGANAEKPPAPSVMKRFVHANQELARHNAKVRGVLRTASVERFVDFFFRSRARLTPSSLRSCVKSSRRRNDARTSRRTR